MAIKTINLFGSWINNVGNIPKEYEIHFDGIKAYSLNNGIMEEYQIEDTDELGLLTISLDQELIGTINYYPNNKINIFSIGLLLEYQEIQLTVEIPYEDQHGL